MNSEKNFFGEDEPTSVGDRVSEEGGEAEVVVTTDQRTVRRDEVRDYDEVQDGSEVSQRTDGGRDTEERRGVETRRYSIPEGESASEVVSLAVLDSGTDDGRPAVADRRQAVEDQQPLYEVVDPDALDSLFEPCPGSERSGGRVCFAYEGHEVVVRGGDEVVVRDGTSE